MEMNRDGYSIKALSPLIFPLESKLKGDSWGFKMAVIQKSDLHKTILRMKMYYYA